MTNKNKVKMRVFNPIFLHYLLYMDPAIGLETHLTQNCYVFDGQSAFPPCNRVSHCTPPTDADIEQIKNIFENRPFTWAVERTDLATMKILEKNGFRNKGTFSAMVVDINKLTPYKHDSDIYLIKEIYVDKDSIDCWVEIAAQVFNASLQEMHKSITTLVRLISSRNIRLYVGYYQAKATTAGMAIMHHDTVSLHMIGTLPEYRRKGLGHAITSKMLAEAKATGCRQAILLASLMGKSIYEHFGFEEYANYHMYCYFVPRAS